MDEDRQPAPAPIAPPRDASERSIFLDDPEHPRMERMFSDVDTWGGLWDSANDEPISLTLEPRKIKASAALMQWAAFQEGTPVEQIAPLADIYLNRYSQSWFNRSVQNPLEYFELVKNNFKEQRDARTSFNGLLAEGARAALTDFPSPSGQPLSEPSSAISPHLLPTLSTERMVQEWRMANPVPAARIPERRALSDMQVLLDEISKTSEQQKSDVRELVAIMAHRSGKSMTSELPPVTPETEARLMDRLTDMPSGDRQYLYDLASLLGKSYGTKTNGIIDEHLRRGEQLASVTGRAVAQPVRQVGRTSAYMSTQRRLTEMRAGFDLYISPAKPDDPMLSSDLLVSNPDPKVPGSFQPQPTIPKDWVPATDEQRKQAIARGERHLRRLQVERELDNVIVNGFDPMEPVPMGNLSDRKDWIGFVSRTRDKGEQAIYDVVGSVPSLALAASGYGIPTLVVAQTSQTFDETLASNPNADPHLALAVASGVAIVNVALERVKFDALLGRYPWLKSLQKFKNDRPTPGARAFNIAWQSGKVLGKEYIAENAQNIVTILGRQMLEEFDPKVKDVPIGKALDDLFASQERILFALVPFVALASGRIGLHEMRNYDELLRNPKNLSYLGLSEDQISRITSEPDPGKAAAILQEEYAKTNQQERQKGAKELVEDENSTETIWSVMLAGKEVFSTKDEAEAEAYATKLNNPELVESPSLNDARPPIYLAGKIPITEPRDWRLAFRGEAKILRTGKPIKEIFGRDFSDLQLTKIAGAPSHATVEANGYGDYLDGSLFLIVRSPEVVEHMTYLTVDENREIGFHISMMRTTTGLIKGYGAHSYAQARKAAEEIGANKIKLIAVGSKEILSEWNGYIVWPKFGFDAELTDNDRRLLPEGLSTARHISDLVWSQEGMAWWAEKGGPRSMVFDLNSDSISNKVFDSYQERNNYNYYGND